jgi:flagellar hook-basal body complex protein FliE
MNIDNEMEKQILEEAIKFQKQYKNTFEEVDTKKKVIENKLEVMIEKKQKMNDILVKMNKRID